jgi:hypothetical protein
MEDAVLQLSSALSREELSLAIRSALCSLFARYVVVFQSGSEYGDQLESLEDVGQKGDSVLPMESVASECYDSGERTSKSWKEMVRNQDPLVEFFPEDDYGEATVTCLALDAPATSQDEVLSNRELIIVMLCEKPLIDSQERQLDDIWKHVVAAAVRVFRFTALSAERDSLNGMLKMCSELIDQNTSLLTKKILGHLKRETGCTSCTLLVVDDQTAELYCQVFNVEELERELRFPVSCSDNQIEVV